MKAGVYSPAQVLETAIDRLRAHDPMGFFEEPVTDSEAPNYSQVIGRPMCFQRMSEKVRGREYRTWGDFVSDFELICSNAMEYNQKRSRVHKAAMRLQRQGRIDLQEMELEARKGIYLLHPKGPSGAVEDETAEALRAGLPKPLNAFLHCPGKTPVPPSSPEPDLEPDREEYSCFSDTDEEDTRGWGPVGPAAMERFLHGLDDCVVWEPWKDDGGDEQIANGVNASRNRGETCSELWRDVQWRCKWLELRLIQLRSQREHHTMLSKSIDDMPTEGVVDQHSSFQESALRQSDFSYREGTRMKRKVQMRTEFQDLGHDKLLSHPFFAFHSGVADLSQDDKTKTLDNNTSSLPSSKTVAVIDGVQPSCSDDECYASRVYTALDIVSEEVKHLIQFLQARRKSGQLGPTKTTPIQPHKKSSVSLKTRPSRLDSKRSRRDFEMEDVATPTSVGTSSAIERPPKNNIAVPHVTQLSEDEIERRGEAIQAWRSILQIDEHSKVIPEEVVAALEANDHIEGSSSEDTSDDAYLARHKEMESNEQDRHLSYLGPQKKHKTTSKNILLSEKDHMAITNQGSPAAPSNLILGLGVGKSKGRLDNPFAQEPTTPRSPHSVGVGSSTPTTSLYHQDSGISDSGLRGRGRGRKTSRQRGKSSSQVDTNASAAATKSLHGSPVDGPQ